MGSEQNQKSSSEICGACLAGVLRKRPQFFGETKGVRKMAEGVPKGERTQVNPIFRSKGRFLIKWEVYEVK